MTPALASLLILVPNTTEVGPNPSNFRIPVSDIVSCRVHHGSLAHRPGVQVTIGGVLLAPAIFFASELLANFFKVWFKRSGIGLAIELTAFSLAILGVWLIYDALRKRPHLRVVTRNGRFKLRLQSKLDSESIATLRQVASEGAGLVFE